MTHLWLQDTERQQNLLGRRLGQNKIVIGNVLGCIFFPMMAKGYLWEGVDDTNDEVGGENDDDDDEGGNVEG